MSSFAKNKGKTYEREVAKFLTNLTGHTYSRTSNSGAELGGCNRVRLEIKKGHESIFRGDIIPPHSKNLVIECKSYSLESMSIKNPFSMLQSLPSKIKEFLEQVRADAFYEKTGSYYTFLPHILFMKITNKGEYIIHPVLKEELFEERDALYYFFFFEGALYQMRHLKSDSSIKYLDMFLQQLHEESLLSLFDKGKWGLITI